MARAVADFMVETLKKAGVKRVYGVVGKGSPGAEPSIDLEAADVSGTIGDAIFLDRLHAGASSGDAATAQAAYPTPEEIEAKKKEMEAQMNHGGRTDARSRRCHANA